MDERKKRIALMAILLLAACSPGIYAALDRIWTRTYPNNEFTYDWTAPPAFDGFVCNDWDSYTTQTETLALVSGSTWITVTEDTYSTEHGLTLLMDFTFTTTSLGARLVITGQYLTLKYIETQQLIAPEGSSFDIPADTPFTPNLALMKYGSPFGNTGRVLKLTFSIDSSNCVEIDTPSGPVTHSYDVVVGIGLEQET